MGNYLDWVWVGRLTTEARAVFSRPWIPWPYFSTHPASCSLMSHGHSTRLCVCVVVPSIDRRLFTCLLLACCVDWDKSFFWFFRAKAFLPGGMETQKLTTCLIQCLDLSWLSFFRCLPVLHSTVFHLTLAITGPNPGAHWPMQSAKLPAVTLQMRSVVG